MAACPVLPMRFGTMLPNARLQEERRTQAMRQRVQILAEQIVEATCTWS